MKISLYLQILYGLQQHLREQLFSFFYPSPLSIYISRHVSLFQQQRWFMRDDYQEREMIQRTMNHFFSSMRAVGYRYRICSLCIVVFRIEEEEKYLARKIILGFILSVFFNWILTRIESQRLKMFENVRGSSHWWNNYSIDLSILESVKLSFFDSENVKKYFSSINV